MTLTAGLRRVRIDVLSTLPRDQWPIRLSRADRGELVNTGPLVTAVLERAGATLEAARRDADDIRDAARAEVSLLIAGQHRALREHATRMSDELLRRLPAVLTSVVERSVSEVLGEFGTVAQVRCAVERVLSQRLEGEFATLLVPIGLDAAMLAPLPDKLEVRPSTEVGATEAILLTPRGTIGATIGVRTTDAERGPARDGDIAASFLVIHEPGTHAANVEPGH
jgi:hypothetical protein